MHFYVRFAILCPNERLKIKLEVYRDSPNVRYIRNLVRPEPKPKALDWFETKLNRKIR